MAQTKLRSSLEAASMTFVGMSYAIPLNYFFINMVSWSSPWAQSISITVIFTIMSFTQKYIGRRIFEWWDRAHPVHDVSRCPTCRTVKSKGFCGYGHCPYRGTVMFDLENEKIITYR